MTSACQPVLAVVHGEGSGSPIVQAESARAAGCHVAWIIDTSKLDYPWMPRLLGKLGTTIDLAGRSDDEALGAIQDLEPDGIITYADSLIPTTVALASRLGLEYHDTATAERLTDKVAQRQALRDGGVPVPRFLAVPADPTPAEVDALAAGVDFPVVLKPRRGAGGRDTVLARDATELGKLIAEQVARGADPEPSMIIEEYLVGASPSPSPLFADYVSVESVVSGGQISHLAVTGRFPLAEPFRESGFVIPSDLNPSDTAEVLDVATGALSVLGVRTGFVHTEVKLTAGGPRIIEVNGRVGGSIPAMMRLAGGIDLLELSARVALGEHIVFDELVPTPRVGYFFYVQAPQWARRVVDVTGLDRLEQYPGVNAIQLSRQPGDEVDWRKGSHQYVYSVNGASDDHHGVLAVKQFMEDEVEMTFT